MNKSEKHKERKEKKEKEAEIEGHQPNYCLQLEV
jgi:hypothetical protein